MTKERTLPKRMTRQEMIELITVGHVREGEFRVVQVYVPGKEITLAHIIGRSEKEVNVQMGLEIGLHAGEDHTGEAIGLFQFTPWESVVIAADIATKTADVEIGFMDRFCGELILMGKRIDVRMAVEEVLDFFYKTLGYSVCEISER